MAIRFVLMAAAVLAAALPAAAEVTMAPMNSSGQAVVQRPWSILTPEEQMQQLRDLSTARCLPYQTLEQRSTGPVCVEKPRR
jgi:hypothetical protein